MAKRLTTEAFGNVIEKTENIRNVSIIAHIDHGKSTLADSLVFAAGLMKKENVGSSRFTDTERLEMEKGVTIKSSSISLLHSINEKSYLVNVIDSPGHVDFSSEVSAALRLSDGSIVVVDVVEGFRSQTETVLKQSFQEFIKPVLMINKIDRLITQLDNDPETIYQSFLSLIEKTNERIQLSSGSGNNDDYLKDYRISPVLGNVCFGSGKDGLGFSIPSFVDRLLLKVFPHMKREKFVKKLWGDYYWDGKKITKEAVSKKDGKVYERTFVKFILRPVFKLYKLLSRESIESNGGVEKVVNFLKKYKIVLKENELKFSKVSDFKKSVMLKFSPAAACMLDMIVNHVPSPVEAQKYRVKVLYSGDNDDKYSKAIEKADANGPVMFYVSKNIEIGKIKVSFGRIFSGTLKVGEKVYVYESKKEKKDGKLSVANIQRCYVMLAKSVFDIPFASVGCVVGVVGLDKCITKTATVCSENSFQPFKEMIFSVSAVVKIGVSTKSPKDLKVLLKNIRRLVRSDPLLECDINEKTGQIVIAGAGEFHLELSVITLQDYCGSVKVETSPLVVSFKETILETSEKILSKAKNKLNRFELVAEPMDEEVCKKIEEKQISLKGKGVSVLKEYGFDKKEIKKIWRVGPDEERGTNIISNKTKGIAYLPEVQDSVVDGFVSGVKEGVLCGEPVRGVHFSVVDGKIHSDSSHRGSGVISKCVERGIKGAMLSGGVRLVEPWYKIVVQTEKECSEKVYSVLKKRNAVVENYESFDGLNSIVIEAKIPVLKSFGVVDELMSKTSGNAFSTCTFSHWAVMKGDPFEEGSEVNKIVKEIRKRKGMKEELPKLEDFKDRL